MKLFLFITIISICAIAQSQNDTSIFILKDEKIFEFIDPKLSIEKVATGFQFTEGPLYNFKDKYLLFSDIPANTIYKIKDGKSSVYKKPSNYSNGLTYTPKGQLAVCEHYSKQIVQYDHKLTAKVLSSVFQGMRYNSPNDLVFKKDGSFYFSDPPYGHFNHFKDQKPDMNFSGVYYCKGNTATLIDSSMKRPNGVALSKDEKKLYVVQSEFEWIVKEYNLDKNGKVLSSKIIMRGADITGNLDGIKTDAEGNIYATGNNGIMFITKEGRYLGTVKLPENPSNLCFGDDDMKSLYITAQKSIYKIRVLKKGWEGY
ncbi:MAG: SMP-30/gluconolactonase/LRE family protein [Cytophagales bacterium]|nr:SMP-30/gluconolactonase/LRE family protein [Cytophagales bacterium]